MVCCRAEGENPVLPGGGGGGAAQVLHWSLAAVLDCAVQGGSSAGSGDEEEQQEAETDPETEHCKYCSVVWPSASPGHLTASLVLLARTAATLQLPPTPPQLAAVDIVQM